MAQSSSTPTVYRGTAQGFAVLVGLQIVCGIYLGTLYRQNPVEAHASVERMRADDLLRILANFHYWGSGILIALSAIVLAFMAYSGWYGSRRAFWFGALLCTVCALGIQITGNLLPFDRHDVQTAAIEAGIMARTPLAGSSLSQLALQGDQFGASTLLAWYFAHRWIFPVGLALGALLAMSGQWKGKGTLPLLLLPSVAAIVLSFIVSAPYGPGATEADFGAQDAAPSWYVWPLHGALRTFEAFRPGWGWIGSALTPSLFGAFLFFLPWIGKKLRPWGVRTIFSLFFIGFVAMALLYGSTPAPAWGKQDVAAIADPAGDLPSVDPVLAAKGKDLFNSLDCAGCHGPNGAGGKIGPNLTKEFERRPDPKWLKEFIRDPNSKKPGTVMPGFPELKEEQLDQLAEWLRQPK